MVTSSDYRTIPLPTPEQLETIDALYLAIAAGTLVTRSHLRIPPEAYRLRRRIRALLEAGNRTAMSPPNAVWPRPSISSARRGISAT